MKENPMSPVQIICAVLVPLFWGLQFVVIKVGLTAFPPLFFVGLQLRCSGRTSSAIRRPADPT